MSVSGRTKNAFQERRGSIRLNAARGSRSCGSESRLVDLPAKDRQLVAEQGDLHPLGSVAAADEHDQLQQPTDHDVYD
jgi:hypothetical protein